MASLIGRVPFFLEAPPHMPRTRGANVLHQDGQAFIVTPSTTRDGRSRIVATLAPGSVVTTGKNTVDHVVTEHGVADLRGRSLADRARALISVADPAHREELTAAAVVLGVLQ